MNVMIKSDLITMKNAAMQLAIMPLVVVVFIIFVSGSLIVGVAAMAIMVPFMYLFSICAYDELNDWERFRLTLPITRRQVAYGRYASTLLVIALCAVAALLLGAIVVTVDSLLPPNLVIPGASAEANRPEMIFGAVCMVVTITLVVGALTYPLIMRFGMTKGTRLAPVVMVLLIAFGIWLFGDSGVLDALFPSSSSEELWGHIGGTSLLISLGCIAAGLALYGMSALLSARLYERRQF